MARRFVCALLSAALCAALLLVPQMLRCRPLFAGAESYLFYSGSSSSQAVITFASAADAPSVKAMLADRRGESAHYADARDAFAQARRYEAQLQFTESAAGVVNYYYRAPTLGGEVWLNGCPVNLHIAVRGEGADIGFPLIFGGY